MEPKFYKTQNVIKSYTKPLVLIIACMLLVYTSCRKDSSSSKPSTATQPPSNEALSSQIAVNLSKSLAGSFGGVNLNDGVDSVSVADHLGPHHACGCGSSNPLCGFFTDSLVNANSTEGDSVKIHTGGELKFYFNCVNNKLSGYTANDSLSTFRTNATSVSEYRVQQFYQIQALNDSHQFIGVNGNNTLKTLVTTNGGTARVTGGVFYQFTNLTIDVINKDILSGTATFDAYGTNWDSHGTIKFLGNHMADFTMNDSGQTYHVNLITGKMTQ